MCSGGRGDSEVLLPREAVHRRQLSHVFGRGGEECEASGLLCHASDARHAGQDQLRGVSQGPRGGHGVPAGEPPPRLPHL